MLKKVYGLLTEKDKIFVPVPEEQKLTEEGLIKLERNITKSARKNENVLVQSRELASHSILGEISSILWRIN